MTMTAEAHLGLAGGQELVDDVALVELIRQRDDRAFVLLYSRYAPYLARVVYHLLGKDDEIDDILQESFVDAFQGIGALRDAARLRWWLATIAVRRVQHVLASRSRRRWIASSFARMPPESHAPATGHAARDIQRALDGLSPKLRIPWILSRVEEQGFSEVAAACSISVATAKRRVANADERVRRRLGMGGEESR
jgi:RNA polymerase sigma-70 factor (ECF subfamily)